MYKRIRISHGHIFCKLQKPKLGKSKHTESREEMYYEIINERYKRKAPIIFSSNEDEYTLPEKIGFAAADRLLGMANHYLIEVEGESYRR